ncbi:DUF3325 domain-containing protein [Rhizosaccharibacter radicis]|uniref:DUF3325 domain-containing protein n=1 Tax=Rhizosaccharibacter radicis TaxID=2782605 RepID=A0ABT1VUK8_9PROT|nr:DUF3325 domain-containing protein [Acetobacteraceae bacterium KSS12]
MSLFAAFLCALSGFASFSLSMARHHGQVLRRPGPDRRMAAALRLLGGGFLLVALALCARCLGTGVGIVCALAFWSVAAACVTFGLSLPVFSGGSRRPSKR